MAFHAPNIKCKDCDHHQFEPIISHRKSGLYDRQNKKITCTICGSENMESIKKKGKIEAPAFGKFSSASPDEKASMLKKRSRRHYQKKIKDKATEMNRNPLKYGFE